MLLFIQSQDRLHREPCFSVAVCKLLPSNSRSLVTSFVVNASNGCNVTILYSLHCCSCRLSLFNKVYKFLCTIPLSSELLQFQDMNIHGKGVCNQSEKWPLKRSKIKNAHKKMLIHYNFKEINQVVWAFLHADKEWQQFSKFIL